VNFLELERKCKKRRVFKILKLILLLFFLSFITLGAYFLYKNDFLLIKDQEQKLAKNSIKEKIENKKSDKMLELKFETNFQELYQSYKNRIIPKSNEENKLKRETKKEVVEKKDKVKEAIVIKSKNLPSYDVCIKLAKEYYEKGDYKQALKWAKNANIQDNKRAGSWIITAKTLYKMGKKDEAIKLLEIYYSYTKNEKIKSLIKNMK